MSKHRWWHWFWVHDRTESVVKYERGWSAGGYWCARCNEVYVTNYICERNSDQPFCSMPMLTPPNRWEKADV